MWETNCLYQFGNDLNIIYFIEGDTHFYHPEIEEMLKNIENNPQS